MAFKLYIKDSEIIPPYLYADNGTPPSGYTETDDPIDWNAAYSTIVDNPEIVFYSVLRDKIDLAYQALGAPTTDQTKVASRWFVIDKSVRNTVHSSIEQQGNAEWLGHLLHSNRESVDLESCSSKIINADKPDIDIIVLGHGEIWSERLTTAQRLALSPLTGFKVWDIDLGIEFTWNGSAWRDLSSPLLTRRYNVFNRARVGTGGGAASSGQIQDVPCIIFNSTQNQEMFITHDIYPEVDLSAINPAFEIHYIASGAAGVGTETVRLQLEIRYRAEDEGFDGAYDETLTQDIDLTTGTAYIHGHVSISLDRTKIASQDAFSVRVVRLGAHANDDYADDWAISQIFLIYNGKGGV